MKKVIAIGIACLLIFYSLILIQNLSSTSNNEKQKYKEPENPQPFAGNTLNPIWNSTWDMGYGGVATSVAIDNSGIYCVGNTVSYVNSSLGLQAIICKYDDNGHELWNRTWGGNKYEIACSVTLDASNIYITGYTYSYGIGESDLFVLKYDKNGNILWNCTWGGNKLEEGRGITVDNQFIYLAGRTASYGNGSSDVLLLKYDKFGNLSWNRVWGGNQPDEANSIAINDTTIFLCGGTASFGAGFWDALYMRYDKNGNYISNDTWGGMQEERLNAMVVNSSGIYLAGYTVSFSSTIGWADALILKYDSNGNLLWNRTWGGEKGDKLKSLLINDQYFYSVGDTNSYGSGNYDALVLKTDMNGIEIWNKTYDCKENDTAMSIGCYESYLYIAGAMESIPEFIHPFILKTDLDGSGGSPVVENYITPLLSVITSIAIFIVILKRRKKEG